MCVEEIRCVSASLFEKSNGWTIRERLQELWMAEAKHFVLLVCRLCRYLREKSDWDPCSLRKVKEFLLDVPESVRKRTTEKKKARKGQSESIRKGNEK